MRTIETGIISDCNKTIVALRKQIKETKDALLVDLQILEKKKDTSDAQKKELQIALISRVRLGANAPVLHSIPQLVYPGGRVKLGASNPGLPSVPPSLHNHLHHHEALLEDKEIESGTASVATFDFICVYTLIHDRPPQ